MGKVIIDMSMSLDGFIAGPNAGVGQPLGDGEAALHHWLFDGATPSRHSPFFRLSAASREVLDEAMETTGALVVGRRTYDAVEGWGGSHPLRGAPVFVLTHRVPEKVPQGTTPFIFVTDGVERAIAQARAAAGAKNVGVAGADVARQCIRAGLADEIHIHLVPVLLGAGTRLFDRTGVGRIELQTTGVIPAPGVTHLRFTVRMEGPTGRDESRHPDGPPGGSIRSR